MIPEVAGDEGAKPRASGDCALILSGAVSQGAFEAGALAVLTERLEQRSARIRTIVGTSAGALSGAVLAAHVRRGQADAGARTLVELWRERGAWRSFLDWPTRAGGLRGLLPSDKVAALVREAMGPPGGSHRVELRMIVTALAGHAARPRRGGVGADPSAPTTFEQVLRFGAHDLDATEGQARVADAAAASACFPVLFVPRELPGIGLCVDGGIVNNTPVSEALSGTSVETVFVIAAQPASYHGGVPSGSDYLVHLIELLIHERLCRDLREAEAVNHWLRELERLVPDPHQRDRVIEALYPAHGRRALRPLELVQIRPAASLGSVFAGFGSRRVRDEYLAEGAREASRALDLWESRRQATTAPDQVA